MGNPQVKGRIRRIQNAMRRARSRRTCRAPAWWSPIRPIMRWHVEFSFDRWLAPTVLTQRPQPACAAHSGRARLAGVPIVENPPRRQSLFQTVEEGANPIPYESLRDGSAGIPGIRFTGSMVGEGRRELQAAEEFA